jgi:hypothetical protein
MSETDLTPSQQAILRRLPETFPPDRIDRLWIFPPHVAAGRESGFVVISLLESEPDDPERAMTHRTLFTYRYETHPVKGGTRRDERVTEEGSAPVERIDRVIAGVLARSAANAVEPIAEALGGDESRWSAFLDRFGLSVPITET